MQPAFCACAPGSWSWKFYDAHITAVHADGTYTVLFSDGDTSTHVPPRHIRLVFDTNDYKLHEIHQSQHDGFTHVNVQEEDGSWVPIDIYRSNESENGVILSFGKGKFEGLSGGYTLINGKLRDGDGEEIKYEIPMPDGDIPFADNEHKETTSLWGRAVTINERIDYLFTIDGKTAWYSGIVRRETRSRNWFKV